MQFLQNYYNEEGDLIHISAEQGSAFAKQVAGDFNPIHDAQSKRFCVPGDLLFSLALQHYGLHQSMRFHFRDLVSADTPLTYLNKPEQQQKGSVGCEPKNSKNSIEVTNIAEKVVLSLEYDGSWSQEATQIEQLIKSYVAFSGQNFPHILVPLMKQHGVMINPKRPLVIYQSMSCQFNHLDFDQLQIELIDTQLEVNGKRGNATLSFSMNSEGQSIGNGTKLLVLSGLREYEESAIQQMCEEYLAKKKFHAQTNT